MNKYFFLFYLFFLMLPEAEIIAQIKNIDSLEKRLPEMPADTIKARILGGLAKNFQTENIVKSENYAIQQIKLSHELNYQSGEANGWNNLGNVNFYKGNYTRALECFNASMKLFDELNDESDMAKTLNNIGAVYTNIGDYVSAANYSVKALEIKEKLGDRQSIASSYTNIGGLYYYYMGELDTAKSYFLKAHEIFKEIGNHSEVANNLINIGEVYRSKKEYLKANDYFLQAMEEPGTKTNFKIKSRAQLSLGISYLFQKKYINAINSLQSSYVISEKLKDMETSAQNLKNLGICFREYGNIDSSIFYLHQAILKGEKTGARDLLKACFIELSESYSANNDFKNALGYYRKYSELKDSMFNIANSMQIQIINTKYNIEKKDNEIILLGKDKKLQSTIIGTLIASFALISLISVLLFLYYNQKKKNAFHRQVSQVEMKALRAQMNPHFIFNSLNSIHKYIQMKDADLASEYLIKFSKLMRLILENSQFQEVPLVKDIKALELYMQLESLRMNNNFSYEIIIDPSIDEEITLLPPLILQPFVENAIWHGLQYKPGEGKIKIEIKKEGNMINCVVEDNGIGRRKAIELKSKTPNTKEESLGIKITDARIDIINKLKKANAIVQIIDLNEGVRVEVKLPLELSF